MPTTITQAVSPGYIYTVTASSEAIVRDVETNKLLCKANNGSQGMFIAIGGTASMVTDDPTATITQSSTTSGGARFEVQQTRPATGEEGVIYLIPITSGTDADNEYEEWIWVKGEWERLGTTGVNLSNYATLTDANTYSGNNTFNGLLLKKNSASLGDTSVLNRSEADARYGRLSANNVWQGVQYMQSPLTMHPNFAIITNHIQGHNAAPNLTFNGLHLTDIKAIDASSIKVTNAIADVLHVGAITSSNSSTIRILSPVNVGQEITVNGNLSIHPDRKLIVDTITTVSGQPLDINDGLTVAETIDTPRIGNYGGTLDIDSDVSLNTYNILANGISVNGVECANMNVDAIDSSSSLNVDINASTLTIKGTVDARSDINIHANAALSTNEIASTSNDRIFINNELCLQGNNISSVSILFARELSSSNNTAPIDINSDLDVRGHNISSVSTLFVDTLRPSMIAPPTASLGKIDVSEVRELQFINSNGNATTLSGVKSLKNKNVTVSYDDRSTLQGVHSMFVQASEGIKVTSAVSNTPDVTIAPSKIEAFQLNAVFGENKYGLLLTPASCQIFGIDFAYGDVWSETNDTLKAQDVTPVPGLDSASYFDTVKIKKPAVSIATTGIGSLSFDYANEAYIRTFPNDGGQGIFEFQAGNWTDANADHIKRGPVDLRKASATELGPTSVLNMEEGDARWVGSSDVAVGALVPANFYPPNPAEVLEIDDIGNRGAYGIAIGPSVTANVYRDIAIGGWLSTSNGTGDNTLLGYNFSIQNRVSKNIIIGQGNATNISANNTIFIGHTSHSTISESNAVAINGDLNGNCAVAISGAAGYCSVAVGMYSIATTNAVAVGESAKADVDGTALGAYSVAGENELVLQAGNVPTISMQMYGGTSWEDRNNTGYLRFVTAKLREDISIAGAENREEITISKPNLWSALDRAKYRGAQPYKYYIASAIASIPALEPNSITHIGAYTSGAAIDLSGITLAQYDDTITTAELWIEVSSSGTTITWPEGMLWPDEADPTVAPSFSGPEASTEVGYITQRIYCVTLRTQRRRNLDDSTLSSVLIASIAYAVDSKLLTAGEGSD